MQAMKRLRQLIAGLVLLLSLSGLAAAPALAAPNAVQSAVTGQTCSQANDQLAGCSGKSLLEKGGYFSILFNAIFFLAGLVATIFLIMGGVNYITSTGDSGRVAKAKNTVMYSIIGLIVVILSRTIAAFVIDRLS